MEKTYTLTQEQLDWIFTRVLSQCSKSYTFGYFMLMADLVSDTSMSYKEMKETWNSLPQAYPEYKEAVKKFNL